MSDRVRNIYNMLVSTREFDAISAADYSSLPDGELKFAIIRAVISNLETHFGDQISGATGQSVEMASVLIAAAKRKMKEYSGAARALNINDAGFRRLFHIPDGDGSQEVVAAGREFVEEATTHNKEFARFGLTDDDRAALAKDLDDIGTAVGSKSGAHAKTVGATAAIEDEIRRGMDAAVFLDAMMKIVYRNNPAKLAAWKSARHIRRSDRPAPKPPTV